MNATVNILCYKHKALSNGEHPLMIRVCKDNKKKYKSLGLSVHPDHWDFEKNRPKSNCPNRELLLKTIFREGGRVSKGNSGIDFHAERVHGIFSDCIQDQPDKIKISWEFL